MTQFTPNPMTIASVTVGRSDYNIYLPVYRRILADHTLRLHLIVAAAHLSPEFGHTVDVIERDGIPIADRVEMTQPGDTPQDIANSISLGVAGFSRVYARSRPDLLLVLGDRYEMLSAVVAALPFNLPVAHIHGGESTEGTMDELIRHAITKMSHVNFATTDLYARRIVQMGESPEREVVCGAPALDNLIDFQPLTLAELCAQERLTLPPRFLLVVYHPITFEHEETPQQMEELLEAIASTGLPALISYPNTDTSSRTIIAMLHDFVARNPHHQLVTNLDARAYYSAMALAAAMVGNSSSGIIEAASFGLPVVNIGPRQQGRLRPENVIDVPCQRGPIQTAMQRALSPDFRKELKGLKNPYGDGHAAQRVVTAMKSLPPLRALLIKPFHDLAKR